MAKEILYAILSVILAYWIGSISFAVIFSKAFMKRDVREVGSGNAGATNVLRSAGALAGFLTFLCDALKGFVACYIGKSVFEMLVQAKPNEWGVIGAFICGTACMLGHVFPVFFKFKGGKGVATSVGIFYVINPIAITIGLAVFVIVLLTTRYVSLASITAALTVVVFSIILYNPLASIIPQIIFTLIMGFIVIVKHTSNIKRLLTGTESKIGKGGKKSA